MGPSPARRDMFGKIWGDMGHGGTPIAGCFISWKIRR